MWLRFFCPIAEQTRIYKIAKGRKIFVSSVPSVFKKDYLYPLQVLHYVHKVANHIFNVFIC